jgi:hypothetical protein
MANLFWGIDSEDGQWHALPASPFLIPAFIIYLFWGLSFSIKEQRRQDQRLNTGRGKELGLRRVQIRNLLAEEHLDAKTIKALQLESLEIDREFQSLI